MPTPLVAVPVVSTTYSRPDGTPAVEGHVTARAVGRSRIANASVILTGSVTWQVASGALVPPQGGSCRLMAPSTGTLYYAITETIEGNVTGPYVVAVDASMAGTGIALAGYSTATDPAAVPTNVYPGTKGDKGDPGTGAHPGELAGNPQTSPVTASAMLGKITRLRSGVNQTLPPAVTDAVVVIGATLTNPADPSPTFTAAGSDTIGTAGATTITDLLDGEVRELHCTTAGQWRVGYDHRSRSSLDRRFSARPVVYSDFTSQTAGTLPRFDSGQATEAGGAVGNVDGGRTTVAPVVRAGAATIDKPSSGGWAGYLDAPTSGNLNRIGCEFTFDAHTTPNGGAAIVLWDGPYTAQTTVVAACHLVLSDTTWTYGVKATTGGALTTVGSGTYDPLTPGTVYRVDVVITGQTAVILLPDGTLVTVSDPLIAQAMAVGSKVACWEPYAQYQTDGKASFPRVWADTVAAPAVPPAAGVSLPELRDVVARQAVERGRNLPVTATFNPNSLATYPIAQSTNAADATNLGVTVTGPTTGHVDVEFEFYLAMSGADTVLIGCAYQALDPGGTPTGGIGSSYSVVASQAQVQGRQSVSFPLTLAPGTAYRCNIILFRVGSGGTVSLLAGGSGPSGAGMFRARAVPTL